MHRTQIGRRRGGACLLLSALLTNWAPASQPPLTALAFAPDGESVVAASQAGVQLLSWPALQRQKTIVTSASNLHCLAFSPQGNRLAVGGGDPADVGIVEIYSWPEAELVGTFGEHDDCVMSVAWHDRSALLTASLDRDLKRWDVPKRPPPQDSKVVDYRGHSRGVSSLCLLGDGKTLVSAGDDQSVRVWDLESQTLVRSLNQHTAPVHALALRPAAGGLPMVASAGGDRAVRLWQPTIGRMVRYVRLEAEPLDIGWLNDGYRIVAACSDGRVRVIDADEVRVTQTLPAIAGWAYAIAIHPTDGSVVVGGADGQIQRVLPAAAQHGKSADR